MNIRYVQSPLAAANRSGQSSATECWGLASIDIKQNCQASFIKRAIISVSVASRGIIHNFRKRLRWGTTDSMKRFYDTMCNRYSHHCHCHCHTIQYHELQWSAVQYNTVQSSDVESSALDNSVKQYNAKECSLLQYSAMEFS